MADDWTRINNSEVARRAISRIEARGKGILLLHDIHPRTVLALPEILNELKSRGYKIVHVVPAAADRPKNRDFRAAMGCPPHARAAYESIAKRSLTSQSMLLADNYALGRKTSPTTASVFDERKIVTAPTPAKSRKKPRALITGGLTPRLFAPS